jgi:hypothetical protein
LLCVYPGLGDWRADGYRWRQIGVSRIPKAEPVMKKLHFQIQKEKRCHKDFRKFVYCLTEEANYVVIQYVGDASFAEDFPHG